MAGTPSGEPALDPSAGGAPSQPGEVIALPDGSREFEHIVNLINPEAVQQVESLLRGGDETGLALATQQFYQYYLDEYEFLFILTDHEVNDATAAASFKPVYRPAQAVTGDTLFIDRSLEHGSERLLGVIAGQGDSSPPLEHEILHYWAAHLDPSLGFGRDRETTYQSHWGLTSVHGQLGGFDGESLECTRPVGALPPDCEAESDGRFIYAVDRFAPHVNRAVDYAPLELYLMGLLPADEVPDRYWVFEDTSWTDTTVDDVTDKYLVHAGGLAEIEFADVLALHGEVPLRAEDERAFRAAFIVVSEAPASDEVMAQVAQWQEIFGNHAEPSGGLSSFEARTGGRATLTTRLGRRRTTSDPLPMPEPPLQCSVTLQDCAEGLACYGSNMPFCGVPGTLAEGDPCEVNADCLPGLGCPNRLAACAPYCDPFDASAPLACATLCTAGSVNLVDDEGTLTGGYCLP